MFNSSGGKLEKRNRKGFETVEGKGVDIRWWKGCEVAQSHHPTKMGGGRPMKNRD